MRRGGEASGRLSEARKAGDKGGSSLDLLGRAKKMLKAGGGHEPTRPQYYHVPCPEGHVIRGLRTEGYQAIRCPTCGEGVFVLPWSPLPDPPAPSTLRARRRRPAPPPPEDTPIALSDAPPQDEGEDVIWLDPDPVETASVQEPASRAPASRRRGRDPRGVSHPGRRRRDSPGRCRRRAAQPRPHAPAKRLGPDQARPRPGSRNPGHVVNAPTPRNSWNPVGSDALRAASSPGQAGTG